MRYNFAKNVSQLVFLVVALVVSCSVKAAMDYNGNPINTNGGITITPQTTSAVLAGYTQSINTNGLLDNTFGIAGIKVTTLGTDSAVHGVAIQPDGKIVVVGAATLAGVNTFTVIRYNVNGSLDTSFGGGLGYVTTPLGDDDIFTGVVLQSDGKIVAGGYARPLGLGRHQFAVVRYNTNGTLDTTFNAAGTNPGINLTTLVAGHDATANGMVLQQDGKIVLGGRTTYGGGAPGGPTEFGLVRYNADGTLDTAGFNSAGPVPGVITLQIGAGVNDTGTAVALQADQKIVLVGYADIPAGTAFAVARYTTAGVLDPSFGAGVGYVTTRIDNDFSPGTVMIQPDQKILVGGQYNGNTCLLVRYNTDGSLDTQTFGDGAGYVTTIIRNNAGAVLVRGQINSLLIQLDGKIVAAGQVTDGVQKFLITRYNLDGSLNTTFGSGATGYVITKVGGVADNSIAQDVALQADGKVVVIGKSATHFAIARYINPFTLVSFTASYGNVGLL